MRALCLTADGTLLATASEKGTIVRVWNVSSSTCLHEFRRGVERATITCLSFSWDDQWLSCTSDKGTTHIFYCDDNNNNKSSSSSSSSSRKSLTKRLFSAATGGSKQEKKSVCQVRGIPHPLACAFIGDVPNVVAVAGWDADGNGALLISEFAAHQEPRRIAYHVLVKKTSVENETEEERRRRRARGWKPTKPDTVPLLETLQITEATMNHQVLSHDDDDFCEVVMESTNGGGSEQPIIDDSPHQPPSPTSTQNNNDTSSQSKEQQSSSCVSEKEDSVRTEPLDDDDVIDPAGETATAQAADPLAMENADSSSANLEATQ